MKNAVNIRTRIASRMIGLALGASLALVGDLVVDSLGSPSPLSKSASAQQGDGDREGRGEGRGGRRGGDGGMGEGRGGRGGEGRGGRGGEGRGGRGGEGRGGRGSRMGGFGGMQDIRELLEPDFMSRDLPLFVDQLLLDDGQKVVVEALMFDYEDEFGEGSQAAQGELTDLGRQMMQSFMSGGGDMRGRMRDTWQNVQQEVEQIEAEEGELSREDRQQLFRDRMREAAQQSMDEAQENGALDEARDVMGEMLDILEEWLAVRTRLYNQFVSDVKVQLTDDQLVMWPAFDRFLVREKTLPKGRLSGEDVNLFMVLDDVGLSDEAFDSISGSLDDYELRLHGALKARNDFLLNSAAQMYKAMKDGDASDARRILERQVNFREAVRNVNDEFRATFTSAIESDEERMALEAAILEESYSRIYRTTTAQRAFDAAINLETLSEDQMISIAELERAYLSELGPRNSELVRLLRQTEGIEQVERGERMVAMMSGDMSRGMPWMGGGGGEDSKEEQRYDEAMERRGELDENYIERLNAMLTPEQQEAMPRRRTRGGGGGSGWGTPEQREEMMKRFDTDGDGEISDEERRAMIEQFRGGRGGGEGGGGRGGRGGEGGGGRGGRGGQGGGRGGN